MKTNSIDAPLGNYYGTPRVVTRDDLFFLELDDYTGTQQVEVSTEFAEAWRKEFGGLSDGSALEWRKQNG